MDNKQRFIDRLLIVLLSVFVVGALTQAGNIIVKNGELNITESMYVDTNTLYVDSSNSRVGIGTIEPSVKLQVNSGEANTGLLVYSTDQDAIVAFRDNTTSISTPPYIGARANNTILGRSSDIWMCLEDGGNVGIGTTSPSQKLEVNDGNIQIIKTNPSLILNDSDSSIDAAIWLDTDSIKFDNYATETKVSINVSSGNVGIGTTSPQTNLHIEHNVDGATALLSIANAHSSDDTDDKAYIRLSPDARQRNAGAILVGKDDTFASSSAMDSYMSFHTILDNAMYERMRITSSGNVGIGTTSPTAKLHIADGNLRVEKSDSGASVNVVTTDATGPNYPAFNVHSYDSGAGHGLLGFYRAKGSEDSPAIMLANEVVGVMHFNAYDGDSWNEVARIGAKVDSTFNTDKYDGSLIFYTGKDTNPSYSLERMRIDSSGNVGIGTTSPGATLHIKGSGGTFYISDVTAFVTTAGGQTAASYLNNFIGYTGLLIRPKSAGSGDRLVIENENNDTEFIVKDGGNVGIGTTSPSQRLDVAGNVRADDFIEYTEDFVGDAIEVLKNVGVREDEGDWLPVEHTTWPEHVIIESIEEGVCEEQDMPEHAECVNLGNNTCKVYTRSLSGVSSINTRAIQQLIEENEMLKAELCQKDPTYSWC